MDFTIAICTHNRRAELDRTLAGLRELDSPGPEFEVLVVDNASTDDTAGAVAAFGVPGFPMRMVSEPAVGLWRARNLALAQARGQYVLFLDDDVTVSPALLTAYHREATADPRAPFLGGPILPVFDGEPSDLARAIAERKPGVYSALEGGPHVVPLQPTDGPWGANCCIRMSAIGAERFDSSFGYFGDFVMGADETEFLSRLAKVHGDGVWVPDARVDHRIAPYRPTWEYLRRSAYGAGRGALRLVSRHARRPWTFPLMLLNARPDYRRMQRESRALRKDAAIGDRVEMLYRLWRARGLLDEARELAFRRAVPPPPFGTPDPAE